jgi:predicted nucleic acid-binding protein
MIVVSDTSPLNYLILIGHVEVLPQLFGRVLTPPAVLVELQHSHAPESVKQWAIMPPAWLEVQLPTVVVVDERLGPGELEAIGLAQEVHAGLLLLDDREGVAAARRMGLSVTGTLGVLDYAAERRLIDFSSAIAALRHTTFHGPAQTIEELLRRDAERRA